jgi:hypothetical protein
MLFITSEYPNIEYSRLPLNPYPSVDDPGYGLSEIMALERYAKNRFKKS